MPRHRTEAARKRATLRSLYRSLANLEAISREPTTPSDQRLALGREIRLTTAKIERLTKALDPRPVGRPRRLEPPPEHQPQMDPEKLRTLERLLGGPVNLAPPPVPPPPPARPPLTEAYIRQILGTPRPPAPSLGNFRPPPTSVVHPIPLPIEVVQKTDGDSGSSAPAAPASLPTDQPIQKTDNPAALELSRSDPPESSGSESVDPVAPADKVAAADTLEALYREARTRDSRPQLNPLPPELQYFLATGRTLEPEPPPKPHSTSFEVR